MSQLQSLQKNSWLKQNIYAIKGIILCVVLILMVYVAIKIAQYVVMNDVLNNFVIRQVQKKQKRKADEAQSAMANQQAAEYGGAAPVEVANIPNNSSTNSNTSG